MKKYYIILPIFILAVLALSACGSSVERTLDIGNQAFVEQDYQQAMEKYGQAMEMDPELGEPTYNLANTLYRLEAFEEAGQFLAQAIQTASDQLAEHGFYNLGNNFFQQELMPEAVEAYKESLRIDSHDLDAKYNLELAMVQQEQQEQQQEEEQEDSSEEQQDSEQEQQDQSQSEDSQGEPDQSEQEQDQSGEDGEDQEQQDQNQNGDPQENQEEQDGQGQPQQVEGLTEEQARQLLAAIGQSSETLQEKLQEIFGFAGMPPEKDW
jgi:hypothetical protein